MCLPISLTMADVWSASSRVGMRIKTIGVYLRSEINMVSVSQSLMPSKFGSRHEEGQHQQRMCSN
jgi:hypothetical protein